MGILEEAQALDVELQRLATGAIIHKTNNTRAALKLAASGYKKFRSEELRQDLRKLMKDIRDKWMRAT